MTIGPVNGSGGVMPEIDLEVMAAGMGPESAIAMASVELEQAAERSRAARTEARRSRRAERREEIDEMRRGAAFKLASGLVSATSTTVAGLTEGGVKSIAESSGQGAGAVLGFYEADAQQEAKRHASNAETFGEQVSDHDETISRAERFADKAMGHHEAVARARQEAVTNSIRG